MASCVTVVLVAVGLLLSCGAVRAVHAAILCVNPGGTGGCSSTIQAAIDAAAVGDTIDVAAGTYAERPNLSKNVTLRGAQAGVDPTPGGARTNPALESIITEAGLSTPNPDVLIEIPSGVNGVEIDGFTLNGDRTNTTADTSVIRCWGNGTVVRNNIIDGLTDVIFKGGTGFTLDRNRIVANKAGFVVQPSAASSVTVSNNTITLGTTPQSDPTGVYLTGVTGATVSGNAVSGFFSGGSGRALQGSNLTTLTVSGNTFTANRDGISIFGGSTFISILSNHLTSNLRYGINIKGADLDIENNLINNNAAAGIFLDRHVIDTQRVNIHGNDVTGNGGGPAGVGLQVTALVTQLVDAMNNWWGSVNGPTIASNPGGDGQSISLGIGASVSYGPWLGAPCTTITADDRYVDDTGGIDGTNDCLTSTVPCATIQRAVNVAWACDTIHVAAGTYVEQVEISKPLTLSGTGGPIIQSPATLPLSFTTSAVNKPVVYVHGTGNVTIEGLTVDGLGRGNANYRFVGIAYSDAGGHVTNVEIKNIKETPFSGAQHGVGLFAYSAAGTARSLEVDHVNMHDFQKTGMVYQGANLSSNVHDNTVTGIGDTPVTAQNGIQVSGGAQGTIARNTVSGIAYTGPSWGATAILGVGAGGTLAIYDNIISTSMFGINVDTDAGITGNHITGHSLNDWGIIAYGPATISGNVIASNYVAMYTTGTVGITGNTITGFDGVNDYGIYATGSSTITGNTVSGTSAAILLEASASTTMAVGGNVLSGSAAANDVGLYIYGNPANATMNLGASSFAANLDTYIYLDNGAAVDIDATSASFAGKTGAAMTPAELYGTEDKVHHVLDLAGLGLVTWNASKVYVSPGGSIQLGIDAATAGDTINVAEGTYDEQVKITKNNLTINGAGVTVKPSSVASGTDQGSPCSGGTGTAIVLVAGVSGVTLNDLNVDGSLVAPSGPPRFIGIYYRNASGAISGGTVAHITNNQESGLGILAQANAPNAISLDVSGVTVSDYEKNGITFNGCGCADAPDGAVTGSVSSSTMTGWGHTALLAQNGVQVGRGAGPVTITGNDISGHYYTGNTSNGNGGDGILFFSSRNNTATGNRVDGNNNGIENVHGQFGICPNGDSTGNEATCNRVTNNDVGVLSYSPVDVQSNVIEGNTTGADGTGLLAGSMNATGNWWGCSGGPGGAPANGCDTITTHVDEPSPLSAPPECVSCSGAPDGAACNDSTACTYSDTCTAGGTCVGTAITCTGDQCNTSTCNGTAACTVTPRTGVACNDSTACTYSDTCTAGGTCVGTAITCTGDQCNTSTCNGTAACTVTPNTGVACNDSDACTTIDTCSNSGTCVGGPPPNCDDGNVCTADSCVPATGCVHPAGNAGTTCRAAADVQCDLAEICDGSSPSCPADQFKPDGTQCVSASNTCMNACVAGSCAAGNPVTQTACCGNGIIDAGEQCDDANQASGDSCPSSTSDACQYAGSGELIRGDQMRPIYDRAGCQVEWYVVNPSDPHDRYGLRGYKQVCADQDPTCDLNPDQGKCTFEVVVCVNNADPNLGCTNDGVNSVELLPTRPRLRDPIIVALAAANEAKVSYALTHLLDPSNPGAGYTNKLPPPLIATQKNFCSAPILLEVRGGSRRGDSVAGAQTFRVRSKDNALRRTQRRTSRWQIQCDPALTP